MFKFFVFCFIGCALGQNKNEVNSVPESPAAQFLGLSAGASALIPNIRATFSCLGRNYGYFADVDNNCQIFHVCHPSVNAAGEPVIYQFSKFCPNQTRFDQKRLSCVSVDDPKIIPCIDSTRFYPLTESRFAELPVIQTTEPQFQQLLPVVEQRVEQLPIEEQRLETLPVKGIQTQIRAQNVVNQLIPTKNVIRNEALPQQIPQTIPQNLLQPITEQRVEQLVQNSVPVEPSVQQQFVDIRNLEPIQQQSIPVNEPEVPVIQRTFAVKQENNAPLTNTQVLRSTPVSQIKSGLVTPAFALRNSQSIPSQVVPQVVAQPLQTTQQFLVPSNLNLRQTVPQTQYVLQNVPTYQPLYVNPQPVVQTYRAVSSPKVIRPSSYLAQPQNTIANEPVVYSLRYQSVPQYLRTNVQPSVVRQPLNPVFTQF
jgi:hypothetical protein